MAAKLTAVEELERAIKKVQDTNWKKKGRN